MTNTEETKTEQPQQSYSAFTVENPGSSITTVSFNGHNYDEWSGTFRLALLAKGKLGYIDETILKPSDPKANLDSWRTTNAFVSSWIFNTIDNDLKRTIFYRDESKQLWDDIKQRFSLANDARIYQLEADSLQTELHQIDYGLLWLY
ncbi:hypothetical protein vseg_017900 [Gypsophila vaccaria]